MTSRNIRSRTNCDDGHIIITGTGRAGSTLLVQYLTALGFDTGFGIDEALAKVDPVSHAGLERNLAKDNSTYVVKSFRFAENLMGLLETGRTQIHAAIIPMRDLFAAAESRRRVTREGAVDGGLLRTKNPARQEAILGQQFYKALFPLVKFQVPIYFIEFPRFAGDADYLFDALEPLLSEHGVTRSEAQAAMARVVDPQKIHNFAAP